jgi:hypothetical protein
MPLKTKRIRGTRDIVPAEIHKWRYVENAALEVAARSALRAALRGSERNRPKEVTGFISLESFPAFFLHQGRRAAQARFKVEIREITPFAVY